MSPNLEILSRTVYISNFSSSSCPLVALNLVFALVADAGENMCFALKNKKGKKKKKKVHISKVGFVMS